MFDSNQVAGIGAIALASAALIIGLSDHNPVMEHYGNVPNDYTSCADDGIQHECSAQWSNGFCIACCSFIREQ